MHKKALAARMLLETPLRSVYSVPPTPRLAVEGTRGAKGRDIIVAF
jgi:hypothetical protein